MLLPAANCVTKKHLIPMKIWIDRVYFREDCTLGFLKLVFSGKYESEYLAAAGLNRELAASGRAVYLCDTLEPRAIPWQDDLSIGQHAEQRIPGRTAIPEGHYEIQMLQSRTYRRKLPFLLQVPEFKRVCMRTGKTADQSRGDILIGRRPFQQLFLFISEAISHGEPISIEISSANRWTYPAPA